MADGLLDKARTPGLFNSNDLINMVISERVAQLQKAQAQQTQQQTGSFIQNPVFLKALGDLGAGVAAAQAQNLGFGPALALGAQQFQNSLTASELAQNKATENLLADLKDALSLQITQVELSNKQRQNEAFQQFIETLPEERRIAAQAAGVGNIDKFIEGRTTAASPLGQIAQDVENGFLPESTLTSGIQKQQLELQKLENEISGKVTNPQDIFQNESKLRDTFLNQSKEFANIRNSFSRISTAAQNPSPAGDLAMIFNFMKMLDPGSVVREGEFANAQNSAGVPARLRATYNNLLEGTRLTPEQRTDFLSQAEAQFVSAQAVQDATEQEFRGIAERNNLNPENVLVDLSAGVTLQPGINRLNPSEQQELLLLLQKQRQP